MHFSKEDEKYVVLLPPPTQKVPGDGLYFENSGRFNPQ